MPRPNYRRTYHKLDQIIHMTNKQNKTENNTHMIHKLRIFIAILAINTYAENNNYYLYQHNQIFKQNNEKILILNNTKNTTLNKIISILKTINTTIQISFDKNMISIQITKNF